MSVCSEAKYSCILKHDNLEAIKRCFVLIKNCNNPHTAHVQQCAHYTILRFADNLSGQKLKVNYFKRPFQCLQFFQKMNEKTGKKST